MAITRLSQSSIKEGLEKFPSFYGGASFVFGDFESIATVTVGSGGAANIEFTSIPSTYQHLQIRMISRDEGGGTGNVGIRVQFNNDTASNYSVHRIYGIGTTANADGYASQNYAWVMISAYGGNTANIFPANVLDILDYGSTAKNKTLRALVGGDYNGSGSVNLNSGAWFSTSAVTSIKLTPDSGNNFAQHTTAALYGVKAP